MIWVQLIGRKLAVKDKNQLLPMITCEKILKNPQAVSSLIGMSLSEFEMLYTEFELAYQASMRALRYTRRTKAKRQRAAGAGRKYKYTLCDRLLMTLFWLRAYTTYKVLGTLYGLDKSTIEDNLKTVMHILPSLRGFNFERPQADIPKLRSMQELIHAFPDVLQVMNPEGSEM
jgi:hypothetical protein